jgi:hypothetical protein|nr:MAG TPA: hypothetical protein [Caudoviricetes sp.]
MKFYDKYLYRAAEEIKVIVIILCLFFTGYILGSIVTVNSIKNESNNFINEYERRNYVREENI